MVLHKQLRVLNRGTPCMILDRDSDICVYSGVSDDILTRLTSTRSKYRDSFVKGVSLVDESKESYKRYETIYKSFLEITVKCKEEAKF